MFAFFEKCRIKNVNKIMIKPTTNENEKCEKPWLMIWRLIISGCKVKGTSIVNKMPDLLRYTLHQTPTTSKGWNRVFDIWKINPIYLISLLLQVIIRPDIIWLEDIIFPFPIPQTEKKVAQITSQDNN